MPIIVKPRREQAASARTKRLHMLSIATICTFAATAAGVGMTLAAGAFGAGLALGWFAVVAVAAWQARHDLREAWEAA